MFGASSTDKGEIESENLVSYPKTQEKREKENRKFIERHYLYFQHYYGFALISSHLSSSERNAAAAGCAYQASRATLASQQHDDDVDSRGAVGEPRNSQQETFLIR